MVGLGLGRVKSIVYFPIASQGTHLGFQSEIGMLISRQSGEKILDWEAEARISNAAFSSNQLCNLEQITSTLWTVFSSAQGNGELDWCVFNPGCILECPGKLWKLF